MFKRVAKHARRKEKEEELGLDDEAKEILGLNDTDDSESDSSSDSGSGSEDEGVLNTTLFKKSLKRRASELDADSGDDEQEDAQPDLGSDEDAESDVEDEHPPIPSTQSVTAQEALDNPIHDIAKPPGALACAICPGKVFKNAAMAKTHIESNAHKRRESRFQEATETLIQQSFDLREISAATVVAGMTDDPKFTQGPEGLSAKARRKRKRDRGGKKRREAREQARLAAGLPLAGTAKPLAAAASLPKSVPKHPLSGKAAGAKPPSKRRKRAER